MKEDESKITYFALTDSRGKKIPFGIKRIDRRRHMYVIGKTGMGKSTMLENMAIQDIRNGEGLAFIDPHGSTAEKLLEYVPEHRLDDVVYFAPFDLDFPVAFNVMEDVGYDKRHLVVSGLMSAFKKIWQDAWSARMEYILSNTLLALLEYPDSTLLDVNRMLIVKNFRKKVVENITDPIVKSFWVDEFANYTDRYTQDATPAIQNKIGQFTSNPLIRNIVGQPKSSFDLRKLMDEKKIIIMNLSKGRVGEGNASLLGSMFVTKVYLAAMSRADQSASMLGTLPSFYFYVDEFQSFANQSFADILSEARKYKLNLIIAHQYIEQMEEEVRDAVFGNVGTTATFRVGPFDAEVLETIFQPKFMAEDLVNLGFAQIYLTLMIDGVGSQPFSATTLPPFDPPPQSFVSEVISRSRKNFAEARTVVEGNVEKWQAAANEPPASDIEKERVKRLERDDRRATREALGIPPGGEIPAGARPPITQTSRPASTFTPRPSAPAQRPQAPRPPVNNFQRDNRDSRPPQRPPITPRPIPAAPAKPALEGANSLREALERATRDQSSLKDTLAKVTPAQSTGTTPNPPSKPHVAAEPSRSQKPAGLPDDVLREMLKVEDSES